MSYCSPETPYTTDTTSCTPSSPAGCARSLRHTPLWVALEGSQRRLVGRLHLPGGHHTSDADSVILRTTVMRHRRTNFWLVPFLPLSSSSFPGYIQSGFLLVQL
ncbi:hypothetical protein RB213_011794 [Colletotrichum asianum]